MRVPDASTLQREQFEEAIDCNDDFLHASYADDYYFGSVSGLDTLRFINNEVEEPVVLDIGAGSGLFLREAVSARPQIIAIGLTAIDARHLDDERISWVFGDFQRPQTWQPQDILLPGTVDLAVSSLTFQHLADPVQALKNAVELLKPGGHLFLDHLDVCIPSNDDYESVEAAIEAATGVTGLNRPMHNGLMTRADLSPLHLTRIADLKIDGLQMVGERDGRVVYGAA